MPSKEYDPRLEIIQRRDYKIVKANEIVQKAKYDLSITELKIMSYIFSMVRPTDHDGQAYTFSVKEFCDVCGIDSTSGKHYATIKAYLKGLRDKSFWLMKDDGSTTTVGWLAKATVVPKSGVAQVKLDEDLSKYIINLVDTPYTQYELICTLPMRSQYSFKLFELLRSYAIRKKITFEIDEFKDTLMVQNYKNFKDLRVKVIEPAIKEINVYTDIEVSWHPVFKGRKVIQVTFEISMKDNFDRLAAHEQATFALDNKQIEGQMSIQDFESK